MFYHLLYPLHDSVGAFNVFRYITFRTAMSTLTAMLVALLLVRTSWENRLTIVLLIAFAAAMYSLRDADLIINLVGAARFGLLALAAYWLIHAVTRPRPVVAGHPAAVAPVVVPASEIHPAATAPPEKPPTDESAPAS